MSIVLANGMKATLIDCERSTLNGYYYGLFVSNTTPNGSTTLASFTECADSGYTATGRQHPVFPTATLNGSNQGELLAPTLVWNLNHNAGDYTIYGYFCVDNSVGGNLVYSERAAAPFTVTAAGQTYSVTPKKVMDTL